MKGRTIATIGCSAMVVLGIVAAGAVVVVMHVLEDPEGLWLAAEAPIEVKMGEDFELVITTTNRLEDRDITLGDLDIRDDYMRGFAVTSVSPEPRSTEIDNLNGLTTMRFGKTLAPGESARFTISLQARRAGHFRGQIDQYTGMQFVSAVIQTSVSR